MSYRFYTSQEFAALNAADERRRKATMSAMSKNPVQLELLSYLHNVPESKREFARFLCYSKKLSPKQLNAAHRFLDAAKAKG